MAAYNFLGSPPLVSPGTPGFSPSHRPYNSYESRKSLREESPQPSPNFQDSFSPDFGRAGRFSRTSQPSIEPLIHDYSPAYRASGDRKGSTCLPSFWDFLYNWWLCISSLVVSLIALGAIVLLLVVFNGKPLPKLPLGISVNTYVSFFSTIAKASMLVAVGESISQLKWLWFREPRTLQDIQLFDDASRGPLGATMLLLKTKMIKLVALGSLITVMSLIMEPFAQQIVWYKLRSIESDKAAIGSAQSYDAGLDLSTLEGGLLQGPDWGMKAAVYDGVFKPSSANDVSPTCTTGNCTFPLFDTLAVCSKCLDVSSQVVINNAPANPSALEGIQDVSYSLPGGATIDFSVVFVEGNLAQGPSIILTTDFPSNLSKESLGLQDPLFTLVALQFPDVAPQIKDGNYYSTQPTTNECALYFCVNTYNASVVNGVLNSTLISSWTSSTGTPTVGAALGSTGMDGTQDAVLQAPADGVNGNHTYVIPAGSLANLRAWLNVTLQGTLNTSFSEVDGTIWANDVIQALNETTDWDGLMSSVALSITSYIRSDASGLLGVVHVNGTAYKMETYVHVRWRWMALPIALVGLSIVFLAATILKNEHKSALAWKSSSLALLFHGLEGVGKGAEGLGQMESVAKHTRVVLRKGGDGEWKLINTRSSALP